MERICFEPQDTLFFRDGRPFNQGEGNDGVESRFPPSPMALVGAARSAWAKELGWKGRKRWEDEIGTNLGGNDEELEGLRFTGPMLQLSGAPLFPMPASLMGKVSGTEVPDEIIRLRPSGTLLHCDLGNVRIPVPDIHHGDSNEGRELLSGWWLTKEGFSKVLQGGVPASDNLIPSRALWSLESKVGNQINSNSDTVEQGMLYFARHVRIRDGVRLATGIEGDFQGFPEQCYIPFGGEARSCWLTREHSGLDLPDPWAVTHAGVLRYAIHVLTPLNPAQPPVYGQSFEDFPGKVVSACLSRAQGWGGWDTINWQPLPMQLHLAAGSVIFMEAEESEKQRVLKFHGKNVGRRKSWGFGLIAIGQWS